MNVRLIRNTLLTMALCTAAAFFPAKRSQAQSCDAACLACLENNGIYYEYCLLLGGDTTVCYEEYLAPCYSE